MEEQNPLKDAIDTLFLNALDRYGDAIEKFWIYESEVCPCCNTSQIDSLEIEGENKVSVNSYIYRDLNVLIAYFLCSKCITKLLKKGKKAVQEYAEIEETLKKAYCESLITGAN